MDYSSPKDLDVDVVDSPIRICFISSSSTSPCPRQNRTYNYNEVLSMNVLGFVDPREVYYMHIYCQWKKW